MKHTNGGFIQFPNKIAEKLAKEKLNGTQWRILWVIFRKTWGWHKDGDYISLSQFEKLTGIDQRNVSRQLKTLERMGFLVRCGKVGKVKYCQFNRNFLKQKNYPHPAKKTIPQNNDSKEQSPGKRPSSNSPPTKDNIHIKTEGKEEKKIIRSLSKWFSNFPRVRKPEAMARAAHKRYGYKIISKAYRQLNHECSPYPGLFWKTCEDITKRRNKT